MPDNPTTLDYSNMTDYAQDSRLDQNTTSSQSPSEENSMNTAEALLQVAQNLILAANSIVSGEPISQDVIDNITDSSSPALNQIAGNSQQFKVPFNPLSPPDYAEVLDYASVQYLNGFLRTQIGRYVKVTILLGGIGTSDFYGFLIGVGTNYIILQELATKNINTIDFYSIKSVYCYYSYSPSTITPVDVKPTVPNPVNPTNTMNP